MRSDEQSKRRYHKEKDVCPRMGHAGPRYIHLLGARALDGCIRSTEGRNELVECGFTKRHNTPMRHNVSHKGALEIL
jgi:hypothetical protein